MHFQSVSCLQCGLRHNVLQKAVQAEDALNNKHVEFFLLEYIGDTASVHFWQPASCNSDLTVLLEHTVAPNQTSCLETSFQGFVLSQGS